MPTPTLTITPVGGSAIDFPKMDATSFTAAGKYYLQVPQYVTRKRRKVFYDAPGSDGLNVQKLGKMGRAMTGCILIYVDNSLATLQSTMWTDRELIIDPSLGITFPYAEPSTLANVECLYFDFIRNANGQLIKGSEGGYFRAYVSAEFLQLAD